MSTEHVALSGILRCADDAQIVLVHRYLPAHMALTRAEQGCLSFDVIQDVTDPHLWHVNELFDSQASFDTHQQRTRASEWGKETAHIARQYTVTTMPGGNPA